MGKTYPPKPDSQGLNFQGSVPQKLDLILPKFATIVPDLKYRS